MRQAGIIAAAGIYALENNIEHLQEDHDNAALLARELGQVSELEIDNNLVQTNMVFIKPANKDSESLASFLQEKGILVDAGNTIRLVTHMQVSQEDILTTVAAIKEFYTSSFYKSC